jgi:chromate transport protein ChrA
MAIPERRSLPELARVFLRLGVVGFGGPTAHIALMDDEVVRRRGWLSREQFLDLLGVAPAFLIVLGCAWAYVRYGTLPAASALLYGVKPVIIVERWGWLSETQLLDAVAVGQLTPGPVFTTATFIGYVLGGLPGAFLSTVGIFLPAFVFVALSGPLVPRIRRSAVAGAFLDGVNVASIALMAWVTVQLAAAAIVDVPTAALGLASAVLLIRLHVSSAWLVVGGALVGLAARG